MCRGRLCETKTRDINHPGGVPVRVFTWRGHWDFCHSFFDSLSLGEFVLLLCLRSGFFDESHSNKSLLARFLESNSRQKLQQENRSRKRIKQLHLFASVHFVRVEWMINVLYWPLKNWQMYRKHDLPHVLFVDTAPCMYTLWKMIWIAHGVRLLMWPEEV